MLYYVLLCYILLCYVMFCYVSLCYVMFCFLFFSLFCFVLFCCWYLFKSWKEMCFTLKIVFNVHDDFVGPIYSRTC